MKYRVYLCNEYYKHINGNKYHYECCGDTLETTDFDTLTQAIAYVDAYSLKLEKTSDSIYANYLYVREYNKNIDMIDCETLYDRSIVYDDIEKQLNVKITF